MANHYSGKRVAGRKPVGKRALSLLMALVMSLSLVQITAFAVEEITNYRVVKQGTEVSDNAGLVTIQKTATHKTGDQFDINLSVTVKKTEETTVTNNPAHIVLVMDRSNSMENNSGRFKNARKAAKTFVSALLKGNDAENDNGNRIAVVGFGTKADTGTAFSKDVAQLNGWIDNATERYPGNYQDHQWNSDLGGTNIQAGIHEAQRLLENDSFTGKKIIVVFSDGMPTYSYRAVGSATWVGCDTEGFLGLHRWNKNNGGHIDDSTVKYSFDYRDRVGSGGSYDYKGRSFGYESDFPYLKYTCAHGYSDKEETRYYETNGDATIAEAQIAQAAGTEIYSVYLGGSDEQENKNALETMKGIVNDVNKNFLSTNKMEDLAKLFGQIAQTITTETSGLTVSDPMGDFITLGDVKALVDAGVITLAEDGRSFTWNVSQSEATINQDGSKTYTLIYPVTLNAAAPEFESGTPYPTNGTTTLTYYVTGDTTAHTLDFVVPTVTATKATTPEPPVVTETSYTVEHHYFINDKRVDNGEVRVIDNGKVGDTVTLVATDLRFMYADKTYTSYEANPGMSIELVGDASKNVIVVSYYLTEKPEPEMGSYSIYYQYYTNGVENTALASWDSETKEVGTTVNATDVPLKPVDGYELTSITTDGQESFTAFEVKAGGATSNSIVYVRYDRETTPEKEPSGYSVHHSYYTNDKFDGESYEWVSEGLYVGDVIENATDVKTDYPTTFKDNEYELTEIDGLPLTLSEIITENVIEVRYDRTVEVEPEVRYTVLHEYYVKGADTAEARLVESFVAEPNQEVTLESIARVTQPSKLNEYLKDYTYEYVDGSPETLTVTADGENTFVLRYERTVEINPDPIPTTYTVEHVYLAPNGSVEGRVVLDKQGPVGPGTVVAASSINPIYKHTVDGTEYTYELKSRSADITVNDNNQKITLTYQRTASTPVNPPVNPPVTTYDYYTVTVNYLDKDSGAVIHEKYSTTQREYTSYDVTAQDKIAIEGYTYAETTGDALTGTLNGNKVINVYYTKDADIDDGDTPTTPAEPGSDIGDDDVPTTPAQPPKTGDSMGLWIAAALVSGMGLVWLALSGKKREERA